MVYITPLHNPKTEHLFARFYWYINQDLDMRPIDRTSYMQHSSRSLYALDLWIKDDEYSHHRKLGVNHIWFVRFAHSQARAKNIYDKRAQLKVTYTEFPHFIYSIDNFNYLYYNIMGEYYYYYIYYIYISPLIIAYFYIKIKINKKKRDSAS